MNGGREGERGREGTKEGGREGRKEVRKCMRKERYHIMLPTFTFLNSTYTLNLPVHKNTHTHNYADYYTHTVHYVHWGVKKEVP